MGTSRMRKMYGMRKAKGKGIASKTTRRSKAQQNRKIRYNDIQR